MSADLCARSQTPPSLLSSPKHEGMFGILVQAAGFAPTTQLHKNSTLILTSEQVTYSIRNLITIVKCLYASPSFRGVIRENPTLNSSASVVMVFYLSESFTIISLVSLHSYGFQVRRLISDG